MTANADVLPTLNLTIRNDVREIASVMERFDDFASQHGISPEVRAVIDIAFDEMLSNIVFYAYRDGDTRAIEIRVDFDGQRVTAVIGDDGVPLNPFAYPAPNTDLPLGERDVGGCGIHLVRTMLDHVSYRRHLNRNIITLVKRVRA
jgi:anti-sigma regulatory factor (Ser/Thr protein kinase)